MPIYPQDGGPPAPTHKNATTTPEMRSFIQTSDLSVSQLAKVLNISEATVRKWRKRDSVVNCPNTPHHLNTTLTPLEEYVVVGLRQQLKMTLDQLLQVTQTFINPHVSRSGLARCLKRHGMSKLNELAEAGTPEKHFNLLPVVQGSEMATYTLNSETLAKTLALPAQDASTVVQVESLAIPAELDATDASSVLIGFDPISQWVYVDIYQDDNTTASNRYMAYVLKHGPFHLRKLLVRNYHTFLARFPGARPQDSHVQEKPSRDSRTADAPNSQEVGPSRQAYGDSL
ncbi:transcriptional regulator [Shewanella sp. AS16]|uniref:transcriptional regulator n=1 Tax=Shewanella sp. AS16 TaxID=2907625 RepID=UPI001F43457D|nr:transcriptional regulator [Shewanella sp. AS16]MCE9685127.1 transcriptional regulator [Shewanella sp. AS16]